MFLFCQISSCQCPPMNASFYVLKEIPLMLCLKHGVFSLYFLYLQNFVVKKKIFFFLYSSNHCFQNSLQVEMLQLI